MTDMVHLVADISVLVNMLLGSTQSETQANPALVTHSRQPPLDPLSPESAEAGKKSGCPPSVSL